MVKIANFSSPSNDKVTPVSVIIMSVTFHNCLLDDHNSAILVEYINVMNNEVDTYQLHILHHTYASYVHSCSYQFIFCTFLQHP